MNVVIRHGLALSHWQGGPLALWLCYTYYSKYCSLYPFACNKVKKTQLQLSAFFFVCQPVLPPYWCSVICLCRRFLLLDWIAVAKSQNFYMQKWFAKSPLKLFQQCFPHMETFKKSYHPINSKNYCMFDWNQINWNHSNISYVDATKWFIEHR